MSRIVTFYSYKGGVGRSMALANIAVLLAQRGLRVMAVDWDLEAPGLERYFDYYEKSVARGGLLSFLTEQHARLAVNDAHPERYADQLWSIDVGGAHPLKLLGSGRSNHLDYARTLDQFRWEAFFERGGGDFLEQLRDLWKADFDVVLIDSRTGMSDSGGICTIQMPDVLVAMFTANYQSVLGVRDVVASVREGRQRLAYDRLALTVLPLVCRTPRAADPESRDSWLGRFSSELGACFGDWLPKEIDTDDAFRWFSIPHAGNYALGERLVVEEVQDEDDDRALRTAYDRIATIVASDFAETEQLLSIGVDDPPPDPVADDEDDYAYDIYVSYASSGSVLVDWVSRFVSLLREQLAVYIGRRARIYFDRTRISDDAPNAEAGRALARSRVLLALLTPEYFSSSTALRELQDFEERRVPPAPFPIVHVVVRGMAEIPERLRERKLIDATKVPFRRMKVESELDAAVARTSGALHKTLQVAPLYRELRSLRVEPTLELSRRVLFVPANPIATSGDDLGVEAREIFPITPASPGLRMITSSALTLDEIRFAIEKFEPEVIHFVGRSGSDGIYLVGEDGLPEVVSGAALASVFRSAPSLRVLVLADCYNDGQVSAFSASVPVVVGVKPSASAKASRSFLVRFYRYLADGVDPRQAFVMAQQHVRAFEPEGSDSPFVIMS